MTCRDVVAGWMQERSVEGRLEELVGLYNAEVHGHTCARLQYHQQRMPILRKVLCIGVHTELSTLLTQLLQIRISRADTGIRELRDVHAFVAFLRSTCVWSRGCRHCDTSDACPHDAEHIPIPTCIENTKTDRARVPVHVAGAGSGAGARVRTSCMQHCLTVQMPYLMMQCTSQSRKPRQTGPVCRSM